VISDFLAPNPGFTGLEYLLYRGLSPVIVQVLASEELDPSFDDAELVDVEDPSGAPLVVDRSTITDYKEGLAAHQAALHVFCAERQIPVALIHASATYHTIVRELERVGLLSVHG
jgi:hypothetical protein